MDYGLIHALWTVLLLIVFLGIVAWAWSGKRKRAFDQAARAPLDDQD
jgi:cytochrome c oxidase cbb3-type subunit 4